MALFKYGFKRKYEGFCECFFAKVCVYNLPQNFHGIRYTKNCIKLDMLIVSTKLAVCISAESKVKLGGLTELTLEATLH